VTHGSTAAASAAGATSRLGPLTRPRTRPRATRRRLLGLGCFVAFVGLWQTSVQLGWVNPRLLVPPSGISATFWTDLTAGRLLVHASASAVEFAAGYLLAVVLAVPLGLLLGASRRLEWALNPYLVGMYATPSQAWLPLLIIALGIGAAPKIVLVALFVFFVVVLNTVSAVKNTDPTLVKVGRSFSASRWAIFTKIVLPAASPLIVTGLRLGVGRAVIGVFLAEMVGADQGIGFYILRAGTEFRVDRVFVGVLILVAASVALTELMRLLEQRLTPWRQRTRL
jgi:NitT/TauT family transport system permease protein